MTYDNVKKEILMNELFLYLMAFTFSSLLCVIIVVSIIQWSISGNNITTSNYSVLTAPLFIGIIFFSFGVYNGKKFYNAFQSYLNLNTNL